MQPQEIIERVMKVYNPSGEEEEFMNLLVDILQDKRIVEEPDIRRDPTWGLFFKRQFSIPIHSTLHEETKKKAVLLAAHLDSDHLAEDVQQLRDFQFEYATDPNTNDTIVKYEKLKGDLGLDDKTGVVTILLTLFKLKELENEKGDKKTVTVYVYFSVCEEVGQKGIFELPLELIRQFLEEGTYAIMVDRMTSRHDADLRHVVTNYRFIPTVVPELNESMMRLWNASICDPDQATVEAMESNFCSDAVEWRGRVDAEIVLPEIISKCKDVDQRKQLKKVLKNYEAKKEIIREAASKVTQGERVSGYTVKPRSARYKSMKAVFETIYSGEHTIPSDLLFAVVNLSLQYDEYDKFFSLTELERTSQILLHFINHLNN